MNQSNPVRVRFAPSPTGRMHLGSARTALYDYLLARRLGGQFILRIEDTDRKRFVPGAEQELIEGLRWLGLHYDEGPDIGGPYGPYRQTERQEIYLRWANELVERGHAFYCFCPPDRLEKVRQEQLKNKQPVRYDGTCRHLDPDEARRRVRAGERHVIRFKMPYEGETRAVDALRGEIVWQNRDLDDAILLKSDGLPTYHLAAMADDYEMKITHVIRGSEWLSTFPLHVNLIRALGWPEPVWIHLSVFLKPSGKGKMSKREAAAALNDGYSIFIKDLKELGYIPEGVLNWIVLMGWGVAEDDVMTLEEMVQRFDIRNLNPAPAAINFSKLDHFNGTHIRRLPADDLARRIKPYFERAGYSVDDTLLLRIVPLIRERLVTLDDCLPFAGWFFKDNVTPAPETLVPKGLTPAEAASVARRVYDLLAALPEITHASAEPPLRALVEALGLTPNQVFGLLRVAVTGQAVSPPLFESMELLSRETILARVQNAIALLERM
ncbi:MAG: glutamate--tRNA ligase [Anaerolineales bacterium]|nr:glutamate--tRNA ligase [Anaerolineales bacterium]MDW8278982.1 glutamate--tRNA ligase [Anaerolineales bacterium]